MINALIERIFSDFTVNQVKIPVSFLRYNGHGEPYVTYMQTDADNSLGGDDDLLGWVEYFDFDVFSQGNYGDICEAIIGLLKANGFTFQPSRSSEDMYEDDTGYYHKTLCFAIYKEV